MTDQGADRRFRLSPQTAFGLKLTLGYVVFALTFTVLPIGLHQIGWFPELRVTVWGVLFFGLASFVLKMIAWPFATGAFNFARYGNDLCLLSFSGMMSAFAFQQSTAEDAFSGLQEIVPAVGATVAQQNSSSLLFGVFATLTLYLLTALMLWGARRAPGAAGILALLSWLAGSFAAMLFMFALCLRASP